MKRIYTGWYTNELRLKWTEQCRQALQEGRRNFRFLLPTRHLIQEVRESLTASGLGVSNQVGTFDDFVDLGLSREEQVLRIDEQGKLAVLTRALEVAGEEAVAPFRQIVDKPGFCRSILEAIEEMKSSGITEEIAERWDCGPHPYVRSFFTIYHHYQRLLREHSGVRLLDRQEGYRVAAEHLLRYGAELFSGMEAVYIDFLTVTPLQFPIVEAICRHVPHVEIFMPYPADAEGTGLLRKSGHRLIKALGALGVEHIELPGPVAQKEEQITLWKTGLQEGAEVDPDYFARFARTVFAENPERLPARGVELIPTASPLQEVRAVAKEIKRLVKDGWGVSDFAIVVADDATYRPLIRRVFQENQIAVSLADIQNVVEVPVVRRMMQAVVQEQADFSEKATYAAHAESVRNLVTRLQLVDELYVRAAQGGVYTIQDLRRDVRAWQTCLDSLESLVRAKRLFGDREVPFSLFWKEWRELLHQQKVQVDAGAGLGVRVFRPAEMRGLSFRGVFLLGLNEGRYPKKTGDHWLVERIEQVTQEQGVILQRREQMELQSLLFRNCIQSAAEKLYLGYQSPEADERNLPSPYLEAVIRCLEEGEWTAPARFRGAMSKLPIPDQWEEISSVQEWRERVSIWLGGERSLHVRTEPDASVEKRFQQELASGEWQQFLDRVEVESERSSGVPTRFAGRLEDPVIKAILREKFHPGYPWSVSVLNDYAVCPFKFFSARVLKIQPQEEVQDGIPVNGKGIFLHDLAQRLLQPLTRQNRVSTETAQAVLESYDPIFEETCRDWEDSELTASHYWPVEKLRLKKEVRLWLERELETLVQSRMRPAHLEWSFGSQIGEDERQPADENSTEELIALRVGGEIMRFRGRIDRIDVSEDGSRFAIYDYKTSLNPKKYKGIKDLEQGTNWQLPVYLAAYSEWASRQGNEVSPLGGGFHQVSPLPAKLVGVWAEEASMWGIKDTKKADLRQELTVELEGALERIGDQREALRDGVFDARPRVECDPYCKYLSVCRFAKGYPAKIGAVHGDNAG
ncbi:PD-(D/E)XK nuclease family protein [Effusibacillus consociatus]|uniref:PD-(D/E)XK nuclease family protein n=1 Tax=Effusibacillus consociatus TaxID=1117041 RepID=A0ABV9PYJ4_9BACL